MKNSHESGPSNTKPFADVLNEQFRLTGKRAGDLAKCLGTSPQVVSRWRSGTAVPQRNKWTAIADFFGVHIRAFLPPPGPAKDYTAEEKYEQAEAAMHWRFVRFAGSKEEFAKLECCTVKELDARIAKVKAGLGITALEADNAAMESEAKLAVSSGKPRGVPAKVRAAR